MVEQVFKEKGGSGVKQSGAVPRPKEIGEGVPPRDIILVLEDDEGDIDRMNSMLQDLYGDSVRIRNARTIDEGYTIVGKGHNRLAGAIVDAYMRSRMPKEGESAIDLYGDHGIDFALTLKSIIPRDSVILVSDDARVRDTAEILKIPFIHKDSLRKGESLDMIKRTIKPAVTA
ncbi:MAG: hypothetical protein V1921_06875 [Candidatus Altiarchaeota archaeon]